MLHLTEEEVETNTNRNNAKVSVSLKHLRDYELSVIPDCENFPEINRLQKYIISPEKNNFN